MKPWIVLPALLLVMYATQPLPAEAQTSDNTFCYSWNGTGNCYDTREAAEAAMRSVLPVSYRGVIQPRTPRPSGFQPNAQGLELWQIDYFIPDQPPAQMFPTGYSNGNAGAPTQCAAAGDPFVAYLCSTEDGAAYGFYNQYKTDFPQCTFTDLGYKNSYASPFSRIFESSFHSGYGIVSYDDPTVLPAANRKLAFEMQCPGWAQPELREINLGKRQTFRCPDRFYAVDGYGSLAYSVNGTGEVISGPLCRPIDPMPTITFYQRGAPSCPAAAIPDDASRASSPGPCHPATGDKSRNEADFQFAGETFTRYYHSLRQNGTLPAFAPGWTHTFSDRVLDGGTYNMRIVRSDGYIEYFFSLGSDQYKSSLSARKKLVKLSDGTYRIYEESGRILSFNAAGRLTRQERSINGLFTIDFTYNGDQLIRAQDQTGRALNFVYTGNRLGSIQLPDSTSVQYEFDGLGNVTRVNYPDNTSKQYHYNESGLSLANNPHALTGITTENGLRYASYGYAANGRVNISERHKGDGTFVEKTTIDYTDINHPIATLPYGQIVTYNLTDDGPYRRISGMTSGGSGYYMSYNSGTGGGVSQTVSLRSQVTNYAYTADYLSSRTEAFGTPEERKFVTARDVNYRTTSYEIQAKSGASYVAKQQQIFAYNARGQLQTATIKDPTVTPNATRITTYVYCEQADVTAGTCPLVGLLKSVNGARTDVTDTTTYTYYQYDPPGCIPGVTSCASRKGDLKSVTNALGQSVQYLTYDDAGRPLSIYDANGVTTDFEYDARGRMTARKVRGTNGSAETDDQITRIEYWPTGLVKKLTLPNGAFTSYVYDDAQRLTGIADNAGNSIAYTLNASSERTREETKDTGGILQRTLSRTYNTLGQLQTVTDAYNRNTGFTYDANSNLDTATDALTRVADNNYDPLDRLSRTLQDMGGIAAETKFTYDVLDNLTQVSDPKLLNTNYTYNGFSDLTQLSSPDTGNTSYTYDSAGNRASQTDARSKVTNYGYDALNRLTSVAYPATATLNTTYTYDTAQAVCVSGETFTVGRLTKIVDGSGNTVYCYDRFGNLVRKVQTTNAKVFTLRYTYNVAGQLTSVIYPDGAIADYLYDTQGRVSEIGAKTASGTRQVLLNNVSYYPFGPTSQWTYGTGTSSRLMKRSLNQNYQPGFVEVTTAGGISLGYEFDEVGNLKKLRAANQADPPKRIFGYDGLNRLLDAKDGTTNAVLQAYAYDKTGNRTSATVGATTTPYTYPAGSHLLSQVGTNTRAYDFNGNTTSIPGTVVKNFVYGDHNRMTQYKEGATVKMNYVYNGSGEQVRKYASGTANVYSLYDEAGHWLGDYNNAAAVTQQVIWFGDLPVGVFVGAAAAQKLHYIEADALGTPRVVVDPTRGANGTAVWTWDLAGEAFGTTAPNQNPDGDANQFVFNMRFPGQRYDSASGLNYNYFRDYEAVTARYVESDPIGLSMSVSTYSYVDSDPLIMFDWYGEGKLNGASSIGGNDPLIPRNLGPNSPQNVINEAIRRIDEALKDPKMKPARRAALRAWKKVAKRGFTKSICPVPFIDDVIRNWARNQCIFGDVAGCQLFEDLGGTVEWWKPPLA